MQNQVGNQVFLSYHHDDQPTISSMAKRLREEGIAVEYYTTIGPYEEFHSKISSMINNADIVVALIDNNYLSDFVCLDQLVRAHDREKPIFAFVKADDKPKLPYFISDDKQIKYQPKHFEKKLEDLAKAIHDYSPNIWMQQIFKGLRGLCDSVQNKKDALVHQQNYLVHLVKNFEEEFTTMLGSIDFKIELGLEKNFLTRATPIFHNGDEIYAVSIVDVSNFWINPDNIRMAGEYIESQCGKKVVRLFIFTAPDQLNKFRNVLQANYNAYGRDQGGVFIMSMDNYYSFMKEKKLPFIKDPRKEDFGVLVFNNEKLKRQEHLLAILTATFLEFRSFNPKALSSDPMMKFVDEMKSLLTIKEGQFGTDFNILRWSDKYSENLSEYSAVLETLFSRHEQEAIHMVFVKGDETIGDILLDVQNKFYKHRAELGMTEIWVNKILKVNARDGKYGGVLNVGDGKYDYLFVMRFPNRDALERYYSHTFHSQYRETLYAAIMPAVQQKYQQADGLIQDKDGLCPAVVDIFHEVESMMSPEYICRYDTTRYDPISNIVLQPGIPIVKYNW